MTLEDLLVKHEGFRASPYQDSQGHPTVGVGHNLDVWPLPEEQYPMNEERVRQVLLADIAKVQDAVTAQLPWVSSLDSVRQAVVMDMAFNLGIGTLLTFKHTLAKLEAGDWQSASDSMLASLWAKQVGVRAVEDARMTVTGLWPDDPGFRT